MNENIDLTKILKDCPIGWKLYSSVYGDVEFLGVSHGCPVPLHGQYDECYLMEDLMHKKYPIRIKTRFGEYDVSHEGKLRGCAGECTLFPSRDQRDWSKFAVTDQATDQKHETELKPFDKVLVRDEDDDEWVCDIFSHIDENDLYYCVGTRWEQCIAYEGNEHLLGTSNKPD